MDILVHLSRREGLPRALPQALAAGKPVIAFDCDGAREICLENETGFLVPIGDRASFTSRLLQLANDPGLREQFGRRGREIVRKDFATQRMVDDLHALYLRLVSKSASEPKS
jgi:glycosyltransferase involved in cell wall biosynthesis